jgi:IS30 family transposase
VSFSEDRVRRDDRLAKLIDAGVSAREAAQALGLSLPRVYAILRAMGQFLGPPRPGVRGVDPVQVAAVFLETGSVNAAAKAVGRAHSTVRQMLVEQGLIEAQRQQRGKPAARVRFFDLLDEGWTVARAASLSRKLCKFVVT